LAHAWAHIGNHHGVLVIVITAAKRENNRAEDY